MAKRKSDAEPGGEPRRSRLVAFLCGQKKSKIVREQEVLAPAWDPTLWYGQRDPTTARIGVVDFDARLDAIDEFHAEFDR